MKFAQDGQTVLAGLNMMQQADAEDAVHCVSAQVDSESRRLKAVDARHDLGRLFGERGGQHILGIVGSHDDPIGAFAEYSPESPSTARQVEHQIGVIRHRQGATVNLFFTPMRKAPGEAVAVLV